MNPWDLQSCQPGDRTSSVHLASEVNGGPRAGYQLVGESRDPVQALGSSGVIEGGSVPPGSRCKPAPAAPARLTVGTYSESRCLLLLPKKKKKRTLEDDGIPLASRAHPASLLPQFAPSAAPEKWQWLSEPGPGRTPCSQHAQASSWHKVKKDSPLLLGVGTAPRPPRGLLEALLA